MPVIVPAEQHDVWLDPAFCNLEEICTIFKPCDARTMKKTAVNDRVNSPENDDAECAREAWA
jgi:putative SOS response-associated peptidase YedK